MQVTSQQATQLEDAILSLDSKRVRFLLDEWRCTGITVDGCGKTGRSPLHTLTAIPSSAKSRLDIAYMLMNIGLDVNQTDTSGQTPLHYAVKRGDAELCEVLLQCGADMFIMRNGQAIYEDVLHELRKGHCSVRSKSQGYRTIQCENDNFAPNDENVSVCQSGTSDCVDESSFVVPNAEEVFKIFQIYKPGLWQAVATESVTDVRKLVNLWCKTDLVKDGKTLRELAVETGNEAIITLIISIMPTMRLVHYALAEDVQGMRELLNSELRKQINLEMRKLSHRGAPLLYFVVRKQHVEMVKELSEHGVCLFTHVRDEDGADMPVFFTSLQSDMKPEVLLKLLPSKNSTQALCLEKLWYRGLNILHTAIQNSVALEAVSAIIDTVGPALVCDRNSSSQTARDMAEAMGRAEYVDLIDTHVMKWVCNPDDFPGYRETLAVRGYEHIYFSNGETPPSDDAQKFLQLVSLYQVQISELTEAAEEGDVEKFLKFSCFEAGDNLTPQMILEGQMKGSGMPILHRAVLHNHPEIVELIVQSCQQRNGKAAGRKRLIIVDDIRDQYRRTALHYAYGLVDGKKICNILLDVGCSEHTLDKDAKEPLDFRETKGSPAMEALLQKLRNKDYSSPDPDPWEPEARRLHNASERKRRFQMYNGHSMGHSHGHMNMTSGCGHGHFHGGGVAGGQNHSHCVQVSDSWRYGTMPQSPYPGRFPTSPRSDFHWPLPHNQSLPSVPMDIYTEDDSSWIEENEVEQSRGICVML